MKIKKDDQKEVELETVLSFTKKEGWFVFRVHKIEKPVLEKSTLLFESNPDIFPIFIGQVTTKIRDIFGI